MNAESNRFDPASENWEPHDVMGFLDLVGPIWQRTEGEYLALAFIAEAKHQNPRGVVQGGMIATLLDRMLAMNVARVNGNRPQATLQLDLHFADAVKLGEFVEARCVIDRQTRSVTFTSGRATVGGRVIATATGIWKMLGVDR